MNTTGILATTMSRIMPPPMAVITPIRTAAGIANPATSIALPVPVAAQHPSANASATTRARVLHFPSMVIRKAMDAPATAVAR